MKLLDQFIGRQIRKPSGVSGWILGHLMAHEHKALVDWMLESLSIDPADHVLDVGCGGGMTLRTLSALTPSGFVAGVDYSQNMVKQASQRNADVVKNGRMEIRLGDVAALPFDEGRFDVVCGVETFYFWPEPIAGLKEIHRVLKPGGTVAMVMDISKRSRDDPVPKDVEDRMNFRVYAGEEMEALLHDAGFARAHFKEIPERAKGWLCVYGEKQAASNMAP